MTRRLSFMFSLALAAACGSSGTSGDGGTDAHVIDASSADEVMVDAPTGCTTDADGDGHRSIMYGGDDCNDADPNDYPGNHETCDAAGHDEDCNPATLGPDVDGDGFVSTMCCDAQPSGMLLCGTDCDDTRATVNPSAIEACNGVDDNCNGMVDEGVMMLTCFDDSDGDTYAPAGAASTMACACTSTQTTRVPIGSDVDCNDHNAGVHPGATDICDGLDNDCNGLIDDGAGAAYYADCDVDGFGDPAVSHTGCTTPTVPTPCAGGVWRTMPADCDDTRASVHPGAAETCNGRDDDCNSIVDDEPAVDAACTTSGGLPHTATAVCRSGACVAATCVAPYNDCSSTAPGCESDPSIDPANCGACGHSCHHPTCAASICTGDYVEIQASPGSSTCTRKGSGTVDCWGAINSASTPTPVSGIVGARSLAMLNGSFACAELASGTVSCWGNNGGDTSPFGTGSAYFLSSTPVDIGVTSARAIAIGPGDSTVGMDVWVIHGDVLEQFEPVHGAPTGLASFSSSPGYTDGVQLAMFANVDSEPCVLRSSGTVTVGGPTAVAGLSDAVSIACIPVPLVFDETTCFALRAGRSVATWTIHGAITPATPYGSISDGVQMDGNGLVVHASGAITNPDGSAITTSVPAARMVAGTDGSSGTHACALLTTGAAVCWGSNIFGELGNGTTTNSTTPVVVTGS